MEVDVELYLHLINASFSGVSGRGKSLFGVSFPFTPADALRDSVHSP